MRLLLLRHGQTTSNVGGQLDTAAPGAELTKLGRAQARAAAAVLGERDIGAIFVSDRVRTTQTAAPLAAASGVAPQVVPGLGEVAAGDFEMRSDHDAVHGYISTVADWIEGRLDTGNPGGENGHEFLSRYDDAVRTAVGSGHETVLVVSHGAAIRTWTACRVTGGISPDLATRGLHNTAMIELERTDEGWDLVQWHGDPLGGDYLEDVSAPDPTGDVPDEEIDD